MGKRSKAKRRAGGGKKRDAATSNSSISTRGEAAAALTSVGEGEPDLTAAAACPSTSTATLTSTRGAMPSSSPSFLRGIISSNDDPGKCALCSDFIPPESDERVVARCCGKHFCEECSKRGLDTHVDLLGAARCNFCNVKKRVHKCYVNDFALNLAEQKEAHLGKPWAQLRYAHSTPYPFHWLEKAAKQGHPNACLELADAFLDGERGEVSFDLEKAKSYAEKAKSLYSGFGLRANEILLDIAEEYLDEGAEEDATVILSGFANETDTNALDGDLCDKAAALLYQLDQYHLAGTLLAKSFCFGMVRSALCASVYYLHSEKYTLSKLWLAVACQTKTDYDCVVPLDDGSSKEISWSDSKDCLDDIRSKLRKNRDSCGGCGAALEGGMRKYCQGCKAYCYCSRDCQELHWNRKENSHRDECKEAKEHWKKVMEAIRSGKVILSSKENQ